MRLVEPSEEYEAEFRVFAEDYVRHGEAERAGKYDLSSLAFGDYLALSRKAALRSSADGTSYQTYWLMDGAEIMGVVRVRLRLTVEEEVFDGHLGVDVAPRKRRLGYGTALLRLGCEEARRLGVDPVIVTCLRENVASKGAIERAGGRFLEEVVDRETGLPLLRYQLAC